MVADTGFVSWHDRDKAAAGKKYAALHPPPASQGLEQQRKQLPKLGSSPQSLPVCQQAEHSPSTDTGLHSSQQHL